MHKGEDDLLHYMHWEVQFKGFLRHLKIRFLAVSVFELSHMQNSHWLNRACCTQIDGRGCLLCCIFSRGVKDRKIALIGMIYRCLPVLCGSDSLQGMYFQVLWMPKHWKDRPIKKIVRNLLSFNPEEPALWPWLLTGVEGGWIGQISCKD